jgi:four helix bundle protein
MADYRKLLVWQRAHALVLMVYELTAAFPVRELYGLSIQARRAAVSVPANIAEGTGRESQAELARFCRISQGSLNELEYHLLLARDLGYIDDEGHVIAAAQIAQLRRMMTRFVQTL